MNKKNGSDNNIVPNLKKLPLKEYFKALPKAQRSTIIISSPKEDLITAIAERTKRTRHTVRCWLSGYFRPSSILEKEIIAEMLQSDIETLFPDRKEA